MRNEVLVDVKERLLKCVGKEIELKSRNSMDDIITRRGIVEYEDGWFYLYDKGKSGRDYNVAISDKNCSKVFSINKL